MWTAWCSNDKLCWFYTFNILCKSYICTCNKYGDLISISYRIDKIFTCRMFQYNRVYTGVSGGTEECPG